MFRAVIPVIPEPWNNPFYRHRPGLGCCYSRPYVSRAGTATLRCEKTSGTGTDRQKTTGRAMIKPSTPFQSPDDGELDIEAARAAATPFAPCLMKRWSRPAPHSRAPRVAGCLRGCGVNPTAAREKRAVPSISRQRIFLAPRALRGLSPNRGRGWSRLRGGSRPACRSRGAGRTSRRLAPHRRRESIPGSPATATLRSRRSRCRRAGRRWWQAGQKWRDLQVKARSFFVDALGAMKAGEAGSEITAPEESADGGDGIGTQWSHGAAVVLFVAGDEIVPGVTDDLPEGRGARAARMMDRGHG